MTPMTPEEHFERIQRQLEFLAASQAQHDARMTEISKQTAENARLIAQNSQQIAENSRHLTELTDLTLRIGRIVEVQAQRLDALAESGLLTDERLNALSVAVERYFSKGNGRN